MFTVFYKKSSIVYDYQEKRQFEAKDQRNLLDIDL